jgi:hypothetical protein
MKQLKELDVMRLFDEKLSQIQDSDTKNRILCWAWQKHSTEPMPEKIKKTKKKSKRKKGKKPKTKAKRPSIVKDLNLRPKNKEHFEQFFQEKKPKVGDQTYAVCVYYLEKLLNIKGINQNHIYTCMKEVRRNVPTNLENALLVCASRHSSIDTSDLSNITITVPGENLVEHKLGMSQSVKRKRPKQQ